MKPRLVAAIVLVAATLVQGRVLYSSQGTQAPPPKAPGAVVLGKVVAGPGASGVAGADVRIRPRQGGETTGVLTDANGQFVFFNVSDGAYDLEASKPGYWFGVYGQKRSEDRGRDFVVASGRAPASVVIPIWKGGEVSGTAIDEEGNPLAGWTAQVMTGMARAGRLRWVQQAERVVTDDRGAYRLSGIYPGDYLIVLAPPRSSFESNGRIWTYLPLIYPAASSTGAASPFTIEINDDRAGTDFRPRPVEAHRVSGRVSGTGAANAVQARLFVWDDGADTELQVGIVTADKQGVFVFPAVPAGTYRIAAWKTDARPQPFAVGVDEYGASPAPSSLPSRPPDGSARVTVEDADVADISVVLTDAFEITGRLVFRGATPPAATVIRSVYAVPSTPDGRRAGFETPDANGAFRVSLPTGSFFVQPSSIPAGWALESITVAGRDALDAPISVDGPIADLAITFTDQVFEVSGVVRTADGSGTAGSDQDAYVLVFPVEQARWVDFGATPQRIRSVRVTTAGSFALHGLPAGEYFAIAVGNEGGGSRWQLAANFARLSRLATRVRVPAAAGKALLDLRIQTGR